METSVASNKTINFIKGAFVLTMVLSICSMILGWAVERVGLEILAWILTLVVPLAAMLGYMLACYVRDRAVIETDQFADSVYYMGFLLTLCALGLSLLTLGTSELDAQGLVFRFGVALATTILGLGARIYFTNFRSNLSDALAASNKHALLASEELKDQVMRFSMDIEAAGTMLATSVGGVRDQVTNAGKDFRQSLKDAATDMKRMGEALKDATSNLSEQVASNASGLEQAASRLSKAIEDAAADVERQAAALAASFSPATESIKAEWSKLVSSIKESLESLRSTLKGLEVDGKKSLDHINRTLEAFEKRMTGMPDSVSELQRAVDEMVRHVKDLDQMAVALRSNGDAMDDAAKKSQQALLDIMKTTIDAVRELRDTLGDSSQ